MNKSSTWVNDLSETALELDDQSHTGFRVVVTAEWESRKREVLRLVSTRPSTGLVFWRIMPCSTTKA